MTMQNADKERAARLRLEAAVLSFSLFSGQFRSLRQGVHGVDFAGVREYTPFDDARQIDWNVTARSTKAYVKLFEEDRDCQIFIVLDRSRSMFTGGTRYAAAEEAALLVSLAADMRSIRVGGIVFDDEVRTVIPPKTGGTFLTMIQRFSAKTQTKEDRGQRPEGMGQMAGGAGTALSPALIAAASCLKARSFVMVISDWRCAASLYEKPLAALASKHDVGAICVTNREDTGLPSIGTVRFEDAESGWEEVLPASSPAFLRKWNRDAIKRISSWQALCARRGALSTVLKAEEDVLPALTRIFTRKGTPFLSRHV